MARVLEQVKTIDTQVQGMIAETNKREKRVKDEILERIYFNTKSISTILTNTRDHIQLHIRNPNERPWKEVTDAITRPDNPDASLIATTERLGREITADFRLIAFLVNNTNLISANFWNKYVYLTIFELQNVVGLNNPRDSQRMQNVQRGLEQKIDHLKEALSLIEKEAERRLIK